MSTARVLLAALALLVPASALAAATTTVPQGVFVFDEAYASSSLDKRWDGNGQAQPLIDPIRRYEPGAGLQGIITANPTVQYRLEISQLDYGITDHWMLAIAIPLVLNTTIHSNLGWTPGDYQATLGRAYSESDFWQWAASMGQPKPPATWEGNQHTLADMVVGTRYRLPATHLLQKLGLEVAGTLLVALPTGKQADPEELLAAGTTTWDLFSYGDVEGHVALDKKLFMSGDVPRVDIGLDVFYAYFRPRTYAAPTGTSYPLLLDVQPYVGDTFTIKPGDWEGGTLTLEVAPIIGPTRASFVSGNSLATAQGFPPLLDVELGYSYVKTQASTWTSDSALWDWTHDEQWLAGDKNQLRGAVTLSLLRVGLPLQLYGTYRNQSIIPGHYVRASDTWSSGVRLLAKFW